jgi:hypothetical protein
MHANFTAYRRANTVQRVSSQPILKQCFGFSTGSALRHRSSAGASAVTVSCSAAVQYRPADGGEDAGVLGATMVPVFVPEPLKDDPLLIAGKRLFAAGFLLQRNGLSGRFTEGFFPALTELSAHP